VIQRKITLGGRDGEKVKNHWTRPVVLNLFSITHRWGMAKFWWGVEIEDIMKHFWLKCKMKSHLFTIKLIGRYKLVHLFTPIGRAGLNEREARGKVVTARPPKR